MTSRNPPLSDLLLSSTTPHNNVYSKNTRTIIKGGDGADHDTYNREEYGGISRGNGDDECSDDAIVILSAVRSPIGKATRGNFKDLFPEEILARVLQESVNRCNIRPEEIADIAIGNVLQPGGGAGMVRIASFEGGFPETTCVASVNRQCASGLEAIASVAGRIKLGVYNIAIAGGVESMSKNSMMAAMPVVNTAVMQKYPNAKACSLPMGITSDNVSKLYSISRFDQDRFAYYSHLKAYAAQESGNFKREIIEINGVTKDEGVRINTSEEALKKLKPAFSSSGTTTAGNSSQVSDGAAALVVSRMSYAKARSLSPLAIWLSYAVAGVPPQLMGIGPAMAIPEALLKANLTINDIDLFEINEAFASQCIYCIRHLGISSEKVNISGGAIALGHPLGCSGARLVVTLIYNLQRLNLRYGVVSLCIGTGMGAAAVIENPNYVSNISHKSNSNTNKTNHKKENSSLHADVKLRSRL